MGDQCPPRMMERGRFDLPPPLKGKDVLDGVSVIVRGEHSIITKKGRYQRCEILARSPEIYSRDKLKQDDVF